METWLVAAVLALGAHFAMTCNVPAKAGRAWFGWPFAVGETGPLGTVATRLLAALATAGFVMAFLSLIDIWVPHGWWSPLALGAAIASLILMAVFFRPNKLLAIAVDFAVVVVAATALF